MVMCTNPTKPSRFSGKVLPKSTRELARKIQSDPKLAAAFLQKAGIITKTGKLTSNYR
jgi:hypothetical protein